jgi:hypothetical protein
MTQGKYGLSLAAIAILAFILSFFGFVEVLVLVVAYVLIVEKNSWLTRQTLQALYLCLVYRIALTVVGWGFSAITGFFNLVKAYSVATAFGTIEGIINFLLWAGLFVLALIAILHLANDKDSAIPIIGTWVDKTMGILNKTTAPVAPAVSAPPVAPVASETDAVPPPVVEASEKDIKESEEIIAQPFQETTPKAPEPNNAPSTAVPPETKAWFCTSCGQKNVGNFCLNCGKHHS